MLSTHTGATEKTMTFWVTEEEYSVATRKKCDHSRAKYAAELLGISVGRLKTILDNNGADLRFRVCPDWSSVLYRLVPTATA